MGTRKICLSVLLAYFFTPTIAFFRMSCYGRLVRARLDPILFPGSVASHVHTISGGSGFSPNMTYEDARASMCSSCEIKEDMSNYWMPQLYVKRKDGTFRAVPVVGDGSDTNGGMTVYYLQRGPESDKLKAFPEGFRMLAGDTTRRNFTGDLEALAISFACLGANRSETNVIPNYRCPKGLRAQVFFPSCWNGKDLDSPDHKSHVSYPADIHPNNGACPPEFPIHLISLFYEILYDTPQFDSEWTGDQHPFVFSNGDPTGFGFHGDFINGWDTNVLQNAVDTCLSALGSSRLCKAVTLYNPYECNSCKLPSVVDEQVDGTLNRLPGCNPISHGPEPAHPQSCPRTELSPPIGNFVDLTSSKQWQYIGCGSDPPGSRSFTGNAMDSDDMTPKKCVNFCSSSGFSYAGLEYGRECYCNNFVLDISMPALGVIGNCTMRCAGNEMEVCGNGWAMSIYKKCASADSCTNMPFIAPGYITNTNPSSDNKDRDVSADASKVSDPIRLGIFLNETFPRIGPSSSTALPSKVDALPSPAPLPTTSPSCPANNCINQIYNPTASSAALAFCPLYTATPNSVPAAIPLYLNNCQNNSEAVSSACSCLIYTAATVTPQARKQPTDRL